MMDTSYVIPAAYVLYLSAAVFSIGLAIVLVKRHVIAVLMGIELMLNAANLNLIAFSREGAAGLSGQMFALFVMIIAAAEAAIALAIVIKAWHFFRSSLIDDMQ